MFSGAHATPSSGPSMARMISASEISAGRASQKPPPAPLAANQPGAPELVRIVSRNCPVSAARARSDPP